MAQGVAGLTGAGVLATVAGGEPAVAFLAGATVVAAAFAVFAWRTAGRSPVAPAGRMFMRLLVGTGLKWLVVGAGLVLAMKGAGLPAGFVLGGALTALLVSMIGLPWLLR
ncbi:ATP synthase I subunit [Luteimonas sp. J16]|nr:ATP synthase I subunit [Luteimonas sp. J16]